MSAGYESLVRDVKKDCEKEHGTFNPEGCCYKCDGAKCFHKYCDKFKWVIDRAKAYGEKTGLNWEDILDKWEKNRTYWYMNYYQECNQPEIKLKKVRVFETINKFAEAAGKSGFRCPHCGEVTKDPCECRKCGWKSYGLLGDLGKGVHIFVKSECIGETIFMPVEWEENGNVSEQKITGANKA